MLRESYDQVVQLSNPINKCIVGVWGDTLSLEDKEAFIESLSNKRFSLLRLMSLYTSVGATFGATALRQHRIGICRCL